MVDNLSIEQRRKNMRRIRAQNTKPELIVRSAVHKMGFRFRLHVSKLPGKPDIVLARHAKVIFVHGCFWHQHAGCVRCTTPNTNRGYWVPKLSGNIKRYERVENALHNLGWEVLVVWECETKDTTLLQDKLSRFLNTELTNTRQ